MGAFVVKWLHSDLANTVQPISWKAPAHEEPDLGYPSIDHVSAGGFDPNVSSVAGPGACRRADDRPSYHHDLAADRA
jgi:hypothetical protein